MAEREKAEHGGLAGFDLELLECLVNFAESTTIVMGMLDQDRDAALDFEGIESRLLGLEGRGFVSREHGMGTPAHPDGSFMHWWWSLTVRGWLALAATPWFSSEIHTIVEDFEMVGDRARIAQLLAEQSRTAPELCQLLSAPSESPLRSPQAAGCAGLTASEDERLASTERHLGHLTLFAVVHAHGPEDTHQRQWTLTEHGKAALAALNQRQHAPTRKSRRRPPPSRQD